MEARLGISTQFYLTYSAEHGKCFKKLLHLSQFNSLRANYPACGCANLIIISA